jgi:hypothetical protein
MQFIRPNLSRTKLLTIDNIQITSPMDFIVADHVILFPFGDEGDKPSRIVLRTQAHRC